MSFCEKNTFNISSQTVLLREYFSSSEPSFVLNFDALMELKPQIKQRKYFFSM